MDLRVRNISPVRFRSRWKKERVVLAPNRQHGRAMFAEVGLEVIAPDLPGSRLGS
jgi:hypothetical protein